MRLSLSHARLSVRLLLALVLVGAWSRSAFEEPAAAPLPIAEGPERTEQRWIVETVLREAVRLAAPEEPPAVSVAPASAPGPHASYAVTLQQDGAVPREAEITLKDGVWDPETYAPLLRELLAERNLRATRSAAEGNALTLLATPRVEVFQHLNSRISARLKTAPLDPAVHEEAALLLGSFALRENAGAFGDARPACNRLTAHLALAAALRDAASEPSMEGRVAHLLAGLVAEAKQPCEDEIKALTADAVGNPALKPWLLAAKLRNRNDWRLADGRMPETLLERFEYFRALCAAAGPDLACATLARSSFEDLPDWPRMLLQSHYAAAEGRRFASFALSFELDEIARVFPELAGVPAASEHFAEVLNRAPAEETEQVLDDGMWAQFLQRHLCHVLSQTDHHFRQLRGYREHAAAFRAASGTIFGRLQLYPMVAMMSEDAAAQQQAAPAVAALAQKHPERLSETVWARLVEQGGAEHAEIEEWFSPAVPAGTAYRFDARAAALPQMKSLGTAELEALYALAPWHFGIAERLLVSRAPVRPSAGEYQAVLGRFLRYHRAAWERFPELVRDNPDTYAAALRKLAELNPELFPSLAEYLARHHQDDQAAQAYLEIVQRRVGGQAYHDGMEWLADYYIDRSRPDEALAVGRLAEESGSPAGLRTMARIQERLANPARAEALYERVEDVFDDPAPLTGFYARQATPESEQKLRAALARVFPRGIALAPELAQDQPPERGVALRRASAGGQSDGLFADDVVVAVNGHEAGTLAQFAYLRGERATASLHLRVYREGEYRELQIAANAAPPLSDFETYHR